MIMKSLWDVYGEENIFFDHSKQCRKICNETKYYFHFIGKGNGGTILNIHRNHGVFDVDGDAQKEVKVCREQCRKVPVLKINTDIAKHIKDNA